MQSQSPDKDSMCEGAVQRLTLAFSSLRRQDIQDHGLFCGSWKVLDFCKDSERLSARLRAISLANSNTSIHLPTCRQSPGTASVNSSRISARAPVTVRIIDSKAVSPTTKQKNKRLNSQLANVLRVGLTVQTMASDCLVMKKRLLYQCLL